MSTFADFWKIQNARDDAFEKVALTKSELVSIQQAISLLQKKGLPSSEIITALQKKNAKLRERWKAERAYWTEVKMADTQKVGDIGEDIGFDNYQVILSPNACKTCRRKSDNGTKIFKNQDIEKSGYGHVPPFHPNCYCILIPV